MAGRSQRRSSRQSGTTLIELLVATTIIGVAVLLLVGAFSTAVIDATLTKRNTAVTAATEYELEKIGAASYQSSASEYSECFAVDSAIQPVQVGLGGACPSGMSLRADVTESDVQPGVQMWTVRINVYPALSPVGASVSVYKVDR